ncbi:MAG: hypothetical protein WHV64_07860, partial [Geminicoccaceae bacterium]
QLDPQFGRLVDHDEEHLVVAVGDRPLAGEQLGDGEIAAVVKPAGEVGDLAPLFANVPPPLPPGRS